jgi:cytochrome c biogenesis protein CcmG/thiol:disulfide interchange protein DsbE
VNRKSAVIGASVLVLGSILVLSLAWGLRHAALENPPLFGRPAPELAIKTAAGEQVSVELLRGTPVVVNFWASWCGPCVEESAVLSNAASTRTDFKFVGADNRDTDSGFQVFEQRHPHSYPAGPIVRGSYQSWGVAGLPATFFINAEGLVVASFTGPLDETTLNHYLGLVGPLVAK